MKKGLISIFLVCLFIFGLSNVSATTVSWDSICDSFINTMNDSSTGEGSYNFQKSSDKLTISSDDNGFVYNIVFNYDNNSISYINTRDVSTMSAQDRVSYAMADTLILSVFNLNIMKLYNPSLNDLEEYAVFQQQLIDNGAMTIVEGNEVSYSNEGTHLSSTEIQSYKLDLAKVEQIVNNNQNNNTPTTTTTTTTVVNNSTTTQKVENPKTLDMNSTKYILFAGIATIVIGGLLISFIPKKSK